jgi:hypothetical protein
MQYLIRNAIGAYNHSVTEINYILKILNFLKNLSS